jgi:hypothetical protein
MSDGLQSILTSDAKKHLYNICMSFVMKSDASTSKTEAYTWLDYIPTSILSTFPATAFPSSAF